MVRDDVHASIDEIRFVASTSISKGDCRFELQEDIVLGPRLRAFRRPGTQSWGSYCDEVRPSSTGGRHLIQPTGHPLGSRRKADDF
eukprot:10511650-Heterocapsa_arctica.AAC.1